MAADRPVWDVLYAGYARFYKSPIDDGVLDRLWGWLLDERHPLDALLCCDGHDHPVGLVHLRACPHPLTAREIGFVDDLYVAPDVRGQGAADALVDGVHALARRRGWPRLRWVTQADNHRGRALYDRYTGGPSDFILYNWTLAALSEDDPGRSHRS